MDGNLLTLLLVTAGVVLVVVLYRVFYRERTTEEESKRELNWVNDSNYNIATSDVEAEVLEGASPAEAQHIVEVDKQPGSVPPTDEAFYAIEDKVDAGKHDSQTVRERLKDGES